MSVVLAVLVVALEPLAVLVAPQVLVLTSQHKVAVLAEQQAPQMAALAALVVLAAAVAVGKTALQP